MTNLLIVECCGVQERFLHLDICMALASFPALAKMTSSPPVEHVASFCILCNLAPATARGRRGEGGGGRRGERKKVMIGLKVTHQA